MKPYYRDDYVTIFNCDCREIASKIGPFDLVLTDPPYRHAHIGGSGFKCEKKYKSGALDGMNDFVLADFSFSLLSLAPMLVAFCSRDLLPDYAALARASSRKFDLHFWHKTNAIPFTKNTWKSDVEYIALMWSRRPGWKQCPQKMHSKVFSSGTYRDPAHPTAKPIKLMEKYIEILAAQTIVDPFAGAGSTGRAAKNLGRKAVLIEVEERYCEIAARRLEQEILPLHEKQK